MDAHTHTKDEFRETNQPNIPIFGLQEEAGVPW